ncbi:MAG: hypothetical protein LJE96_06345 [Deltaproteobacteria bacterium]|nr:hypothetical protein [Deltaproteobacteria bacterium]
MMQNENDNHVRFNRLVLLPALVIFLLCQLFSWKPVEISYAGEDSRALPGAPLCAEPTFELTPNQLSTSLWARQIVSAETGGKVLRQHTRDLDTLYGDAAVAHKHLKQITLNIAACTGGTAVFPPGGGLKGRKRAEEKIEVELGGDASLLMDITRSSIAYDTVDQVYGALEYILRQGYEVVRLKDRALEPLPSGFWDIHLNLRMPNGHIAELQLHLKKIQAYSNGPGHRLYEKIRGMESKAFREKRSLTPEERESIDRFNCEQRRFYQAAFKQGQIVSKETNGR